MVTHDGMTHEDRLYIIMTVLKSIIQLLCAGMNFGLQELLGLLLVLFSVFIESCVLFSEENDKDTATENGILSRKQCLKDFSMLMIHNIIIICPVILSYPLMHLSLGELVDTVFKKSTTQIDCLYIIIIQYKELVQNVYLSSARQDI